MTNTEAAAIVGIGCRFPSASSPDALWSMLVDGVDAISEVPADRWAVDSYYSSGTGAGRTRSKWGGFVEDIDRFDAEFFGISPREAELMDPQQRLLLEVVHEAFEDAGTPLSSLVGQRVGVYVGGFTLDYMLLQLGGVDYSHVEPHAATGSMMTLLANRLSYVFGFTGPSVTVDTACSSSLTAAHLAFRALQSGDCDVAVVAGANAMLTPAYTIAESRAGMLSPTGRSRAFDSRADGYVRGEGAGAVVLRSLRDVRRDGQRYYAAIRGTAANQDGRSEGITVPSGEAQQRLMRSALAEAGVAPGEVAFVEAHGTGTPVGDPIEANAIGAVVGERRYSGRPCYLGSIKTNIGHLEAAAGVAGLIKAALQLHHGQLPPHLHLETPNPAIDLDALGLRIPRRPEPLQADDRFACVNSFGFGGANAHVVLERAAVPADRAEPDETPAPVLLPLSAKSPAALAALAQSYADLCQGSTASAAQLAAAAGVRRDHHPVRRAVVGSTPAELAAALAAQADGDRTAAGLAFVYSGMGPQWAGMGAELYATEPVFRAAVDEVAAHGDPIAGWSLAAAFTGELAPERMEETEVAQPANFALQVGLTALWRSWGVEADVVVGHSAGEPAAAWAAGVLSLADAVQVSYARSITQQTTTGRGRLLAVGEPLDRLQARLTLHPERRIDLAAVNSPTALTVVGADEDVAALAGELEADDVFCRALAVKVPYHSFYMETIKDDLLARVQDITALPARIPLVSTVTGGPLEGPAFDAGYWYRNVREPVRFEAAVRAILEQGVATFLEIGPHPVLTRSIAETAEHVTAHGVRAVSSLRRGAPERETALHAAAELYTRGADLDWTALTGAPTRDDVRLPLYPWQRKRYWHPERESARLTTPPPHPLLSRRVDGAGYEWEVDLDAPRLAWLDDHRIEGTGVFPGAGYLELALWAGREVHGSAEHLVCQDVRFLKALYLDPGAQPRVRLHLDAASGAFSIRSAQGDDDSWTTHASGRLGLGGERAQTQPSALPTQRSALRLEAADAYAELAALGLDYGPEFRTVEWVTRHDAQAVARVSLSAGQRAVAGDYVAHPLVVDAGLQVLALAAMQGDRDRTFMPTAVDECRVHAPVPPEVLVRTSIRRGADDDGIVGDVSVFDLDGRCVLEALGCRAQDVRTGAGTAPPVVYYSLEWQRLDDPVAASAADPGRWVVVGDSHFADLAGAALADQGADVQRVRRGLGAAELRATLDRLAPVRGLLDLGPLSVRPADGPEAAVRAGQQAMHDFQACAAVRQADPPRTWLVTQRAQPVRGEVANSLQAAVWGVGRVGGHFELQSVWGGLVDVDELSADVAARLARQVLSGEREDQLGLYGSDRYAARIRPVDVPARPAALFRRDGAYLVTGGLGGLGLEVARWMVRNGARHLVLAGRRGLPPRHEWSSAPDPAVRAVQELEALGASVEVLSCDVADVAAVRGLREGREREGRVPIRGVVHSAGTSVPQLLVNMSDDDFRSIALAKVHGGWALDQVFPTGLDFFVVFSSVASLVVSAGQTNYAAGNAYLDSLVFERRSRGEPALSVNWGPWGDVGMATKLDLVEFFVGRGLQPTMSAQGTESLGRLLLTDHTQVAPLAPDWTTAIATYPMGMAPPMLDDVRSSAVPAAEAPDVHAFADLLATAAAEDVPCLVREQTRRLVAKVLRYPEDDLRDDLPLPALGLDSMMAIELRSRLEKALGANVPVVTLLRGATLDDLVTLCTEHVRSQKETDDDVLAILGAAEGLSLADLVGADDDR
jgi:acyl transferase domain-containing protein/acyl carrier protein